MTTFFSWLPACGPARLVLFLTVFLTCSAQAQTPTFTAAATYPTGVNSKPLGLAVGDVNGDAQPDLLVAKWTSDAVGVLLGNGNGTFQALATYSSGYLSYPRNLVAADINGDGHLDIVTANSGSNSIGLLLGNGTGTFPTVINYPAGGYGQPWDVTVADVNGDGRPDLLATNSATSQLAVLLNTAAGMQAAATYSTGIGTYPTGLAVRDVNADGRPDVLTTDFNGSSTSAILLLGNGNGTFQAAVALPTGSNSRPVQLAVGDVNTDGLPDVLTANFNSSTASVLLGNGNGTFQAPNTYSTGNNSNAQVIALADMNGDMKLDLVTANSGGNSAGVLLGNGNGTFQPAVTSPTGPGGFPVGLAVADFNGDSKLDIAIANNTGNSVAVLLNTTTYLATRTTLPGTTATLHPNPTGAVTFLSVAGLPATVAQVQATLFDATGRAVGQQQLAAAQGTARAEVPTAGLAAGLYVLRLTAYGAQGQPVGSLPAQRLSVR
jgi:hypothetical protein